MSKHHEKAIAAAQASVAAVGQPTGPVEEMTREQIESFIKGFGISAAGVRRIVDRWTADQETAHMAGWESHADSVYFEQW